MANFEINLRGDGNGIVSIWVTIAGTAFPEEGWADFPAIVLAWWGSAMADLVSGASSSVECRFMDGPYWIAIDATERQNVRFGHDTQTGPQIDYVGTAAVIQIAEALLGAIVRVLSDDQSIIRSSSQDVAELRRSYARLRSIVEQEPI